MLVTNSDGLILSCSDDPGQCRHIGLHVASGEMEKLAASGELNSVTDLGGVYRSPALRLRHADIRGRPRRRLRLREQYALDNHERLGRLPVGVPRCRARRAEPRAGHEPRHIQEALRAPRRDDRRRAALRPRRLLRPRARGQGHRRARPPSPAPSTPWRTRSSAARSCATSSSRTSPTSSRRP